MNKNQNNSASVANLSFNTMTRQELRQVATKLGVKRGRDKTATVANLVGAVMDGKIQFKSTFIVARNDGHLLPNQPIAANAVFQKKFRNYNGFDKVELAAA